MNSLVVTGLLVAVAAAGASLSFFWKVRRHGAPLALVVAGSLGLCGGTVTAGLGLLHLAAVTGGALRQSPVRYDFRGYALLLLGVTLVALGTRLAAASVRVARGEGAAWGRAAGAAAALLVVTAPLVPIQDLAIWLSALVGVDLLALLVARARLTR